MEIKGAENVKRKRWNRKKIEIKGKTGFAIIEA